MDGETGNEEKTQESFVSLAFLFISFRLLVTDSVTNSLMLGIIFMTSPSSISFRYKVTFIYVNISLSVYSLREETVSTFAHFMYQFSSVAQSCPTLCDPMNRSTPGLPVHHQLLEFTQTHIHRVRDAIQPSHPRSSPSPPAPNPSQHQGLFQ